MSRRPDYDDSTAGEGVSCPSCGTELASALRCELRHDVEGADTVTHYSNLHTISTG